MNIKKVFSILMIATGILMLFIALIFGGTFTVASEAMEKEENRNAKKWETFQETAIETQGMVVDVDNGTTIEFYAADGGYYSIHLSMSNSTYPVGREVTVYYNPDNPDDAMAPEIAESTYGIISFVFSGLGLVVGIFIGFTGLIFLIIGIILGKKSKE